MLISGKRSAGAVKVFKSRERSKSGWGGPEHEKVALATRAPLRRWLHSGAQCSHGDTLLYCFGLEDVVAQPCVVLKNP